MPFSQGGSGSGGGGQFKLFDSTLVANAPNIDTGAGGIAGGHGDLTVYVLTRTADAGATAAIQIKLNNDAGANYDYQNVNGSSTTLAAATSLAANNWQLQTHGNGGTASYAGLAVLFIPSYSATTFNKVGTIHGVDVDATAASCQIFVACAGWRSTAAISQITVTGATANLLAGSRLAVFGSQ